MSRTGTPGARRGDQPDGAIPAFSLFPLLVEALACGIAMNAFIALGAPIARATGLAAWQVGAAQAMAGACWTVMARVWGRASDRYGRRRILLIGVAGFSAGIGGLALLVTFVLQEPTSPLLVFTGLMAGRVLTGLCYSAVPTTSAALVADHVAPSGRAAALASVGAAGAIGMIIGPGLAGVLGAVDLALPLYLTAILPLMALVVLWRRLPESRHPIAGQTDISRLGNARLAGPMTVAFLAQSTLITLQVLVGFVALDRLRLAAGQAVSVAGVALGLMGTTMVLSQLVVRRLRLQPRFLVPTGAWLAALGLGLAVLAQTAPTLCVAYAIAACGLGWLFPAVVALAANRVKADQQGAAAGVISSAQGFAAVVAPIGCTFAYGMDGRLAFAALACTLALAGVVSAARAI